MKVRENVANIIRKRSQNGVEMQKTHISHQSNLINIEHYYNQNMVQMEELKEVRGIMFLV